MIFSRLTVTKGEGIMGAKGEGFAGAIIKDTWTITRWGVETGGRWGGVGGKGRKLYLNNNKNVYKK